MICSTTNRQIKMLAKLMKSAKTRRQEGVFITEGIKMVKETASYGEVTALYLSEEWGKVHGIPQLEEESRQADEKRRETLISLGIIGKEYRNGIYVVSDRVFAQISDTVTPQGILAVVKMPQYDMKELLTKEKFRLVLLENLQDPGNLGTIVRTAEAAGMDGVILSSGCVDILSPKVVRSTMGAIFRVPFFYCEDFVQQLKELKNCGTQIFAAHLEGKAYYHEVEYPKKSAVIIGNESNGITEETKDEATILVKIPMCGNVESLNASVAAGLFMYEIYRKQL